MAIIWIPSLIRDLTGGQERIAVPGATVRQVIANLEAAYPGVKERLCEGDRLSPAIAVAVDGQVTRRGLLQPVGETSEVHFVPAVSGG
ncbi:MAG: MoaD/ThiS family protein [Chloroflexi bacterium]|nr:MoaD/ThiS family protein [Chloroflexota bacterium]